MKKKAVGYGLFDSRMVLCCMCSLINFRSSSSSVCDRWMFQLISVAGAPSFSSMAWSHDLCSGNFLDSWSLNTRACFRYCGYEAFREHRWNCHVNSSPYDSVGYGSHLVREGSCFRSVRAS